MTQLESLRKKEHFLLVLKQKAVSNNFFSIYRKKNFIQNYQQNKQKLYITLVMKKKIGPAVKRNRNK
jgi:ribonuclease P protein component